MKSFPSITPKSELIEVSEDILKKRILEVENPFPERPTTTDFQLPDVFCGREEEAAKIKDVIDRVAESKSGDSLWVKIEGSGGIGKSTILGFVYKRIKEQNKDFESDLIANYLDAVYLNMPLSISEMNFSWLYRSIMRNLGKGEFEGNFLFIDFLAYETFVKLAITLKKWNIRTRLNLNQIQNMDHVTLGHFFSKSKNFNRFLDCIIKENIRIRQTITSVDINFIKLVIKIFSPDLNEREKSREKLGGIGKSETDCREYFRNMTELLKWIFGKICLVIGIDHMEENHDPGVWEAFFRVLINIRNNLNHSCIVTIGSTETWLEFYKTIGESRINMLEGLSPEFIQLSPLTDIDVQEVIKQYLEKIWEKSTITPRNEYFPFTEDSIAYLYLINGQNLRKSLNLFFKIFREFKINSSVTYFTNMFDVIRIFGPKNRFRNLNPIELEVLNTVFNRVDRSSFDWSRALEMGIFRAFNILKDKYLTICEVEHEPRLYPYSSHPQKYLKPDIKLTLFSDIDFESTRRIEIQVKFYGRINKEIELDEFISSIELLKHNQIDYLIVISTVNLSQSILNQLTPYKQFIGRYRKLDFHSEFPYLALLLDDNFVRFFGDEMKPEDVENIIENIQGIDIETLLSLKEKPKNDKPISQMDTTGELTASTTDQQKTIIDIDSAKQAIIELFMQERIIRSKDSIIFKLSEKAVNDRILKNAVGKLTKEKKIHYIRKSPSGWRIFE